MRIVPVFPLPNAVLFPGTVLPLHVFEQRYRDMVRDTFAADGQIAVALLEPDFEEDYLGSPDFHRVGTVGRIEQLEEEGDGRFYFNLVGEERVAFDEIPSAKSYRVVRVTPRIGTPIDEPAETLRREQLDLMASYAYLLQQLSGESQPGAAIPLNERLVYEAAVNGVCANLPVDATIRQELLESDDLRERHQRAQSLINDGLKRVLRMRESTTEVVANQVN